MSIVKLLIFKKNSKSGICSSAGGLSGSAWTASGAPIAGTVAGDIGSRLRGGVSRPTTFQKKKAKLLLDK